MVLKENQNVFFILIKLIIEHLTTTFLINLVSYRHLKISRKIEKKKQNRIPAGWSRSVSLMTCSKKLISSASSYVKGFDGSFHVDLTL